MHDFELVREHCKGKAAHKAHGCTGPKMKPPHMIAGPIRGGGIGKAKAKRSKKSR